MARRREKPPANRATPKRVTIRDVAAEAGVHFTTVSMALRNHPRLPEETRQIIKQVADRLGYRPDPMLTALNSYRASKTQPRYQATIGWINNWPRREDLLRIRQFREYFEGARARAEELGYVLEEFWLHEPRMTPEHLHRIFRARNITTLLIAPQPESHAALHLDFCEFSAVAFGHSLQPSILHLVTSHHFHSMNHIMRRLVELGYRRIGLCYPAEWDEKAENSCQGGLMLAHWKWPQLQPVQPFLNRNMDDGSFSAWLRKEKPDVIISYDETAARLQTLGYRLPEDIGFVGLNLKEDEKTLSGIYQNDKLIGRISVELVVAMLHRGERGMPAVPICTLVESVWVPGSTLRKN